MAQCPVCLAEVSDDFGLIECHSCGAQLLVHVDGRVEHSSGEPPVPPADALEPEAQPTLVADPMLAMDTLEDAEPEAVPQDLVTAIEPEVPAEEPNLSFLDEDPEPPPPSPAVSSSPDLSDIAEFGNSEASGGRDGMLRYNLHIEGIDTSDVREAFREAITDRKFMWDTEQILRSIRQGEVRIQNVTASKAYMLVIRLRSLPLKIQWEQYAIHQA